MTESKAAAPVILVMGVTGSGKSTVGALLADRLQLPFFDADDYHSSGNKEKLASDIPLNDADREPWLAELSRHMQCWSDEEGAVLACSALKHRYRSIFRAAAPAVQFVFLDGDPALIAQRIEARAKQEDHVVKDFRAILEGQFRDLEIPSSALRVDIHKTPDQIVDEIVALLGPRLPK